MIRRPALSVPLVLAALALSGCVAAPPAAQPAATVTVTVPPPSQVPVSTPTPTPTQAAVVAAPAAPEPAPAPTTFTMPAAVGMNLQLAQDTLQALGSYVLDQTDASGLGRLQVDDSNWHVCGQSPAPGSEVPIETVVTLSAVKLSELCP